MTPGSDRCQIKLSKDLEGLVLTIPESANNLLDDLPFKE
jgi:hypothetical protein